MGGLTSSEAALGRHRSPQGGIEFDDGVLQVDYFSSQLLRAIENGQVNEGEGKGRESMDDVSQCGGAT